MHEAVFSLTARDRMRVLGIATVALMSGLDSGWAQQRPSTTITSFRGLEWGSSVDTVLATFGEPEEDSMLDGGLRMLAFRDSLVGQPSVVLFGILPDDGLVKGQEVVNALEGQECIDQIRGIQRFVNLQYPLIHPTEEARNNTSSAICEAAKLGHAHWHRQWADTVTGSVISVRLDAGSTQISMTYESRRFREWVGAPLDVVSDDGDGVEGQIGEVP
jgi:hypothetical protein